MSSRHLLIPTCDLQFSFKKKFGCSHAVFVLRKCFEYFVSRGSTVFMAALDVMKAFDRVNHSKLFTKLCDTGLPVCIIRLIMNWYSKTKIYAFVRWDGNFSSPSPLRSCVRQGRVQWRHQDFFLGVPFPSPFPLPSLSPPLSSPFPFPSFSLSLPLLFPSLFLPCLRSRTL